MAKATASASSPTHSATIPRRATSIENRPGCRALPNMEAKSPAFERCEDDLQSLRRPGTVELRAGGPFDQWDQWEAALSLDQTVLWEVALFELVYSEELVGRFRPNRG